MQGLDEDEVKEVGRMFKELIRSGNKSVEVIRVSRDKNGRKTGDVEDTKAKVSKAINYYWQFIVGMSDEDQQKIEAFTLRFYQDRRIKYHQAFEQAMVHFGLFHVPPTPDDKEQEDDDDEKEEVHSKVGD